MGASRNGVCAIVGERNRNEWVNVTGFFEAIRIDD